MGRPAASSIEVATPRRILEAAEAEFARCGFTGARLADIAKIAGIRRPSLLYHFPSKEALYNAVVEAVFARTGASLGGAMAQPGDFQTRLRSMVEAYVRLVDQHPAMAPIIIRELLDGHGPGREIFLRKAVPLLHSVETYVQTDGRELLRDDVPVRAAILQISSDILLRAASGDLRREFWGEVDHAWTLAKLLLLRS